MSLARAEPRHDEPTSASGDIVLLGAGHTHLHVLRHWPRAGGALPRIVCVSAFADAAYSGLLPAVLAMQQPRAAMQIPLEPLCRRIDATLIVAEAVALDLDTRRVTLNDGRELPYGILSVGVGSVPTFEGVTIADESAVLSIKPMQTFPERFGAALQRLRTRQEVRVVTVGAGAGGVEVTLCIAPFVRAQLGAIPLRRTLVGAGPVVADGVVGLQRRVSRTLTRAGVRQYLGRGVVAVARDSIQLDNGEAIPADIVIWATGAAPPPLCRHVELPKDPNGFLLTSDTLQSSADAAAFVVGDAGTQARDPAAKAGVHAVRQGPVLVDNLRRLVEGSSLRPYRRQREFLRLLNTGDGRAIGAWRQWSFEGRWCLWWKNRIDREFAGRYQVEEPT